MLYPIYLFSYHTVAIGFSRPRPVDPSNFALNQFYSDETEVNRLVRLSLFYELALARISARRPVLAP